MPVTFAAGDLHHARMVNAVIGADGRYDRKATRARIAEVAAGVAHKFALGLLAAPDATEETG